MASGIFIVPALTLMFGLDIRYAIGASLVAVIGCSCGSAASAMENRLTNVRLAILLEIGTTLGALTGVVLSGVFAESALYLCSRRSCWSRPTRCSARGRPPARLRDSRFRGPVGDKVAAQLQLSRAGDTAGGRLQREPCGWECS